MPSGTIKIQIICPWHDDGDFHEETYFDKNNNILTYDSHETNNIRQPIMSDKIKSI